MSTTAQVLVRISGNRYTLLNDQPRATTISVEDRMPITLQEKLTVATNAAIGAIGSTVGIVAGSLSFTTTSIQAGGLGVGLSGAAAIGAITGVGIISGLTAIPITYFFYNDLMSEAEALNEDIRNETNLHKKAQEKLFFELMRFRSLCLYEDAFIDSVNHNIIDESQKEIDKSLLITLVNRTHKQFEEKKYVIESNENLKTGINKSDQPNSILFTDIVRDSDRATNKDIRSELISQFRNQVDFDKNLTHCFRHIADPLITNRRKAAAYGATAGLVVAGAGLGTGWVFGGLVIGAGLCAAIPVIGWAILGISCIVMGVLFGLGIGFCKQKNIQRNAFKNQVQNRNAFLNTASAEIQRANYHKLEQAKSGLIHENEKIIELERQRAEDKRHSAAQIKMDQNASSEAIYKANTRAENAELEVAILRKQLMFVSPKQVQHVEAPRPAFKRSLSF